MHDDTSDDILPVVGEEKFTDDTEPTIDEITDEEVDSTDALATDAQKSTIRDMAGETNIDISYLDNMTVAEATVMIERMQQQTDSGDYMPTS